MSGAVALAGAFAAGAAANWGYNRWGRGPMVGLRAVGLTGGPGRTRRRTAYACPMHPQVVSDGPGTCPICGMALVPAQLTEAVTEAGVDAEPAVRIEPEVASSLGVKIERVTRTTLKRRIETPGFVQQIEPAEATRVLAPFNGRIAALHFKRGQWLEQRAPLVTLDSDTSSNVTLFAPHAGMVFQVYAAAGDSVKSGSTLLELAELARASVLANAFQRDAAWIQTGQPIEVRLPQVSRRTWPGVVNQGAISLDPSSQNMGVQLSFTAPAYLLKISMYVVATIYGDARRGVLALPQEAIIRTESEDRVILALGDGRFKPVRVHTGIETDDQVEIAGGLKEGDSVVVSAQFLIDSESNLQASLARMTAH